MTNWEWLKSLPEDKVAFYLWLHISEGSIFLYSWLISKHEQCDEDPTHSKENIKQWEKIQRASKIIEKGDNGGWNWFKVGTCDMLNDATEKLLIEDSYSHF